jgi:hypothetical protein
MPTISTVSQAARPRATARPWARAWWPPRWAPTGRLGAHPCAFNGCTALRPSVGRYPQQGIAPISHTRDTAGPMALSVADLVLLDRAITGGSAVKPVPLKRVRLAA